MNDDEVQILTGNSESDADSVTGCGATLPCDPRRRLHRYLMLFFICFLSFGSYFCYDNPSAMQDIMLKTLKISATQFMNFYALYSWPNVVLCFIGGFLIDRVFGIRLGTVIFSAFVVISQVLFAVGAYFNSLALMYFARFVLGIGGESLAVAQNTYCTTWFKSNEINFVFGLQLSMSRVGSTANMLIMQSLFVALGKAFNVTGTTQLAATLLIAGVTCVYSLVCGIILAFFDRRASRILKRHAEKLREESILNAETTQLDYGSISGESSTVGEEEQKIQLKDILKFPLSIWLICVICVAYYVTVFPFVGMGLTFFERKYGMSPSYAASVNSLVYIVSAVASPFFGAAIDFSGRNLVWLIIGITVTLGCHACFAFTSVVPPIAVMVVMGIAYSILASSLWPMVGLILPNNFLGTAYGIIQAIQNLGLAVISVAVGAVLDSKGYFILELFFVAWLYVALAAAIGLYVWDSANGSTLNESGAVRRERLTQSIKEKSL